MRTLPTRSPTFVFLDTEGIEPRWSTLEAILNWRVEFFINFPLGMSMKRNIESPKIVDYFGTTEAVGLFNSQRTGVTRALINLYKSQFAKHGLIHSPENDRLIRTRGNLHLYYLLLVSKSPEARKIMTWVFDQPDLAGQQKLL